MRISKKATIYDIATETNISASTVAAVLNGSWKKRRIAEKTALLIQKVAGKRGYSINLQAVRGQINMDFWRPDLLEALAHLF